MSISGTSARPRGLLRVMSDSDFEGDTDVFDLPIRPPAPAMIADTPRHPVTGAPAPRVRRDTLPYVPYVGRVVLQIGGGR